MTNEFDGLEVTVSSSQSGGTSGNYYQGEIEEDTWHRAKLVEIKSGKKTYKGKEFPAWIWVYELLGEEFEIENSDGVNIQANIIEKTSQKFTGAPRTSKAYERYCQLTGEEPESGEKVQLKDLFGTQCKLMISNTTVNKNEGEETITFHNIEKVSIKGLEKTQDELADEFEEDTEKNIKKAKFKKATKKTKKKKSKKEDAIEDEDDDDIFEDLGL
jgi:hypothetical protein